MGWDLKEINLPINESNDLGTKMASEEITGSEPTPIGVMRLSARQHSSNIPRCQNRQGCNKTDANSQEQGAVLHRAS